MNLHPLIKKIVPHVRAHGIMATARAAQLAPSQVSAIVNGHKSCTVYTFAKLCKACNLSVKVKRKPKKVEKQATAPTPENHLLRGNSEKSEDGTLTDR